MRINYTLAVIPGAEIVYRPSLSGFGSPGFAAAIATAAKAPRVRI